MSSEVIDLDYAFKTLSPDIDETVEQELGPNGPGVLKIGSLLKNEFRLELIEEMNDENRVHWWDAGGNFANKRDVKVIQNHDVFALKLSAGRQEPIRDVPKMHSLAKSTEKLVRSLSRYYPSLNDWLADEMSYHKYYDKDVGLSYHRDNERFSGLIVVVAVEGECDFMTVDREPIAMEYDEELDQKVVSEWNVKSEIAIPTEPGDVILTRATGLYEGMKSLDRPEHAVMNSRVLPRVSFMARANLRPLDKNYGFTYYNWP